MKTKKALVYNPGIRIFGITMFYRVQVSDLRKKVEKYREDNGCSPDFILMTKEMSDFLDKLFVEKANKFMDIDIILVDF